MLLYSFFVFFVCSPVLRVSAISWATCMSLTLLTKVYPQSLGIDSFLLGGLKISSWSWSLSFLSIVVILLMIVSDSELTSTNKGWSLPGLYFLLLIILLFFFHTTNMIFFFLTFETSAVMIFFLIIYLGYQPERMSAALSLMIYTSMSGLVMMGALMFLSVSLYINDFTLVKLLQTQSSGASNEQNLMSLLILTAFFVKAPVYGVHLWLPKAHVEASGSGSMLLAGVLLKMGGHGMVQFSWLQTVSSSNFFYMWALMGGALISVACVWQTDFKILIAYSSVAHMGLVVACISSLSQGSLSASMTIMLAHGVSSTMLFNLSGVLYSISSTRQLLLNWGMLNLWPLFSIFWFLGNISNMGTPPSINFWGEMLASVNLILYSMFSLTPLAVMLFLSVGYSLVLYGSIQSGQSLQSVSSYKLSNINSISFSTQSVLLLVSGSALSHLL